MLREIYGIIYGFFVEINYFRRSTRNEKMRLLSRAFRMDAALLAGRDAALYQWKLNLNDLNDVFDIQNGLDLEVF